jgi:hypothetical protein
VITTIVFVVMVLAVQTVYFAYYRYEETSKGREPVKSNKILDGQRQGLEGYRKYTVNEKTKIAIPIERAMSLVAKEAAGN